MLCHWLGDREWNPAHKNFALAVMKVFYVENCGGNLAYTMVTVG